MERTSTPLIQACAFCANVGPLRESHVLPAFVFRWLRGGSGTGHIRNTDNPNRRIQDGVKLPWLCATCESNFSRYETAFATKLFHRWGDGRSPIRYGEWLLRFSVSVSWRVLRYARGRNANHIYSDDQNMLMDRAELAWRRFLQGSSPHPGEFEQHLLPLGIMESTTIQDLPDNFNRFMARAVTMDIIGSSKTLLTFAKLGPFAIFGHIQGDRKSWRGTKVHVQDGVLGPTKYVLPVSILDFLADRSRTTAAAIDKMSDAQKDKVDKHVIENLDTFVGSEQFKAVLADARMFGSSAVIRKPRG